VAGSASIPSSRDQSADALWMDLRRPNRCDDQPNLLEVAIMTERWCRGGSVFLLVVGLVGGLVGSAAASDIGHIAADQVTDASYRYFLGDANFTQGILYTHDGDDRGVGGPQHDLCRDAIADHFETYGLTVTFEPVSYGGNTYYNVVGTKLGITHPDQEYIIGAHYDSVDNPGADDNASGVSLVLECARIISQYPSEYTIRFIAFTREEQGLYGSYAYADDHALDDILGMISADMVAYDTGSNRARIYRRDSSPMADALGAAVEEYGQGLSWVDAGWISASDHAPFDQAGFDACLLIEYDVWSNPHYHQPEDSVDTPGYINYAFAVRMTRSMVGMLVDVAGVLVDADLLLFSFPDGHPATISPAGGTTMTVAVSGLGNEVPAADSGMLHYNRGFGWEAESMTAIDVNLYEAVFPPTDCATTLDYFFSAESQSGEVYASPNNAPDTSYGVLASYGRDVFYEELLDSDPGWTTEGDWAWGDPTGGGGEYGNPDPTSGYTGNNVYGYNLFGDYANNLPERHLTSTAIDCTGLYGVTLSFQRWLGVEQPTYDHAYIRVSNNGTDWVTIWENAATITDATWQAMQYDISAVADDQPTVYLRWTMGTTDGGWRYCGWNIDDITLDAIDCNPPFTVGDLNCDGVTSAADIDPFVLALTGGQAAYEAAFPNCFYIAADINDDGSVSAADIDGFVQLLTSGG
jgi:hypothetical protein